MQNDKKIFCGFEPAKMHSNLRILPMHFKKNLEIYQTQKVMKEVVKYQI